MKDDDFDEEEEPQLDEESLDEEEPEADEIEDEEELDDDLALDDESLDEAEDGEDEKDEKEEVVVAEPAAAVKTASGEEPLDVLLQERTAAATLEDEDEEAEEEPDVDERGDGPTRIMPRRPGEFLCASCFLVLPRSQLADAKRMLCRDCA